MHILTTLIGLASAVTIASAQYSIDPNSVPISTRDAWCESQIAQCPEICLQTSAHSSITRSNDCVAKTLTYSCVCSNGITPNVSQYSLTLPYYICQEWGNQCVANCGQDNACASACREDHPCGAQDPRTPNTTTTTSTRPNAHSATPTGGYTGFADGHSSSPACRNQPVFSVGGCKVSAQAVAVSGFIVYICLGAIGFGMGL